ncbi:TPA: hypothetical protein N2C63_006097 [Pseudomonas aeruginosa]|nr:hypothetical protein [Pseudomonas aeruginosa]
MSAAAKLAADQRDADMAHHKRRIEWLKQESPAWACGTTVARYDKEKMLLASLEYLANPDGHFNHCNCEPLCR